MNVIECLNMNTVISEEFHITATQMEQSTTLTLDQNQSILDNTPLIPMMSSSSITGENLLMEVSNPGEKDSVHMNVTNSAISSSNLKSHVKPQEILEKEVKPRILKINKEDIEALCQMLNEFREGMEWSATR